MMREDEVRRRLQRRLGDRLTPGLWEYLADKNYVAETGEGLLTLSDLEQEARRILAAGQPAEQQRRVQMSATSEPPDRHVRAWALSDLVKRIADEDPDVVAFRDRYLATGLLPWTEVPTWIEKEAEAAGPATVYVTFALPTGVEVVRHDAVDAFEPPIAESRAVESSVKILRYAAPGDTWTRSIATVAGTVLDHLRWLSESVAKSYAWQPAQATVYVLTGIPPLIEPIRVTSGGTYVRNRVDCGWATRIVLDIDPAVPTADVARAHSDVRRRHGLDRRRALSVKQARLAVAAADDSLPWATRMKAWNEEFPEWSYSAESNFRRDARRAQEHILYPAG